MKPPPVPSLLENAGLGFAGARVPRGLIIEAQAAERMLAAPNSHGKQNADVLRPYVDAEAFRQPTGGAPRWSALLPTRFPDARGESSRPADRVGDSATDLGEAGSRWVVDFPADLTSEEASLYAEPWRIFRRAHGVLHARADPMRIAIARIDSFLAAPLGRAMHGLVRIGSETLPGEGVCVVATDDDFIAAVLQSGVFAAWVHAHGGRLRVWHVASFPFPWAPRTERGALTREQLELRDRVIRTGDGDLDDAVAAAYGWRIADEAEVAPRLKALHGIRS